MEQQTRGVSAGREDEALDPDTEQRARVLRSEIEQTREELTETVEAIQERLRPANVVASAASATTEKVKNMAYNAADRADEWMDRSGTSGFVDRIKANPFPLALTIVGAAWMMAGSGSRSERSSYARRDRAEDYPSPRDHRAEGYAGGDYASTGYTARSEPARYGRTPAGASVGDMVGQTRQRVKQTGQRMKTMVREYPLAVSAAAMIVGASLGMVAPETEKENELMGEARDTAIERAQEAASTAVGKVKEATADVVTRTVMGE